MGTEALWAASAAVRTNRPSENVIAHGKNCIIKGDFVCSAARTRPRICSML